MRKVILGLGISIDGYIARLNGRWIIRWRRVLQRLIRRWMGRKTVDAAKDASLGGFDQDIRVFAFTLEWGRPGSDFRE